MKTVYIARGLPGSGKSSRVRVTAARLRAYHGDDHSIYICSNDDFWLDGFGRYQFDMKRFPEAYAWNFNRFCRAVDAGGDSIFVDNTNLTLKAYGKYVDYAIRKEYAIVYLYSETPWRWDVDECFKRNTHGVPRHVIEDMKARFEGPML